MGWYSTGHGYRAAVSVNNSGAAASVDVSFIIPADMDHIWNNVQSAGEDIVLTAADGQTVLDFQLVGFDIPTRVCTVEIAGLTLEAVAGVYLIWLYYDNPTAISVAGTPVVGATVAAEIDQAQPSMFAVVTGVATGESPQVTIQKTPDEEVFVWWLVEPLLESRRFLANGSLRYEEVFSCRVEVTQAGTAQPAMVDNGKNRFSSDRDGTWIRTFVQAGTGGVDYTLSLDIITQTAPETRHRHLEPRAILKVRDISEV